MFNLLPENLKDKVRSEYAFRRAVIILLFVIGIQVSFVVLIFPTWIVTYYKQKELTSQFKNNDGSLTNPNIDNVTPIIKSINQKLNIINGRLDYPRIIPFINTVISKKTSSIHIDQISYTVSGQDSAILSVGGVSLNRETLVAFVKSLKDTGIFKTVDSPISNFTKDKNIDFSISLLITK